MALPLNMSFYGAPISAGQSLSVGYTFTYPTGITGSVATDGIRLGADTLVTIGIPSGWTTANLSFQVSLDDGATYANLYDETGAEVVIPVTTSPAVIMLSNRPSYNWRGINRLKVRSGTAALPVNQVSNVTVTLIGRPEIL